MGSNALIPPFQGFRKVARSHYIVCNVDGISLNITAFIKVAASVVESYPEIVVLLSVAKYCFGVPPWDSYSLPPQVSYGGTLELSKKPVSYTHLFSEAEKFENANAAYQLGYIYHSEKYGLQNNELAINYFRKALSAYLIRFNNKQTDSELALRIGTF